MSGNKTPFALHIVARCDFMRQVFIDCEVLVGLLLVMISRNWVSNCVLGT